MRLCSKCNKEMIEDLNLMGGLHGEKIEVSNRFPKGNSNKITVKAAVCSKCGNISFYTNDIKNIQKISK